MKLADYIDRATLILHDGKGNVFAAPDVDGGDNEPYFFPGGGIYPDEGLYPVPDEDTIRKGLEREGLEELGYKLKDIQDFGFKEPSVIHKGRAWQQRQLAKKGVPYKGIREHLRAAVMDGEDKSLHGSAGDDFHQWYPEYIEAGLLAKQLEDHNEKHKNTLHPSAYASRAKK